MAHSLELKERLVQQMLAENALNPDEIALDSGVSKSTLWRWRKEAVETMPPSQKQNSNKRTPAEKLRLVLLCESLQGEELGAVLRREGLHLAELDSWRTMMLQGLAQPPAQRTQQRQQLHTLKRDNKTLTRELKRKDAALAEAAALLVLSKKARRLLGDEDNFTTGNKDKLSSI